MRFFSTGLILLLILLSAAQAQDLTSADEYSQRAIADLIKAIEIKPDPRFLDDRGNRLAKHGELDRALTDLNKAIEIAPQSAKAYGDRALIRLLRGETSEAEVDF